MHIFRTVGPGGMLVVVAAVVAGCEPEDDDPAELPRLQTERADIADRIDGLGEPAQPDEQQPDEEQIDPPAVDFPGSWPGQADHDTFELMWLGGDREVELREQPRLDAPVVGVAGWTDAHQMRWEQTLIRVEHPRPLHTVESIELMGTAYDVDVGQLEAREEAWQLDEDERLYAYRRNIEGDCFLGIGSEVVLTDCLYERVEPADELSDPDETDETVETDVPGDVDLWSPLSKQWWVGVRAEAADGWLLVDDVDVEVLPRRLEGYDEFDETPGEVPME